MPDSNTSKVVIQEINLSKSISRPASLSAGQVWDAHFYTLPEFAGHTGNITTSLTIDQYGTANPNLAMSTTGLAGGNYPFALMNAVKVPGGSDTAPGATNTGTLVFENFDLSAYTQGQKRVIGLAFEVHDTTAELYRQGSVTVYRLPQVVEDEMIAMPSTGAPTTKGETFSHCKTSRCPPANLSQALLLAGSRQWESWKGAYCVAVMDEKANDLKGNQFSSRLFTSSDTTDQVTGVGFGSVNIGASTSPYAPSQLRSFLPIPFHTSGAYFAGLNYESTLLVNLKVIVEVAPTPQNAQLVVLAQPSPDYDPVALEIYKAVASKLPPGVPVGDNASGDFWDRVLQAMQLAAPGVAALPFPGARIVSGIVGGGASIIRQVRNQKDNNGFGDNNSKGQGAKNVEPSSQQKKKKKVPVTMGSSRMKR
jgi:hypothetical protein